MKATVSATCEVMENKKTCGEPTTHAYPVWKGRGYMALCARHAKRHLPHGCWPLEQLKKEGKIS